MNRNLLIIGAGQYGIVAKEIAESMLCFDKIDFLDDKSPLAIGKVDEYQALLKNYSCAFMAVGNPMIRSELFTRFEQAGYVMPPLISPLAFVSGLSKIMNGAIVEPMAVVQANSVVGRGCLVCSGTVIKHNAVLEDFCYIDCNAVVMPEAVVPGGSKVEANTVFNVINRR